MADQTQGLVAYLLARLDEEEAAAKASRNLIVMLGSLSPVFAEDFRTPGTEEFATRLHFDNWGPGRVLAEITAKRAIIAMHAGVLESTEMSPNDWHSAGERDALADVLFALAQPYTARDDFPPEWRTGLD